MMCPLQSLNHLIAPAAECLGEFWQVTRTLPNCEQNAGVQLNDLQRTRLSLFATTNFRLQVCVASATSGS